MGPPNDAKHSVSLGRPRKRTNRRSECEWLPVRAYLFPSLAAPSLRAPPLSAGGEATARRLVSYGSERLITAERCARASAFQGGILTARSSPWTHLVDCWAGTSFNSEVNGPCWTCVGFNLVPEAGFEPARPVGQRILLTTTAFAAA